MPRTYNPQHGYIYEDRAGKTFHIRFYVHGSGKRRQRSAKLCDKDSEHLTKDAPAVVALAEAFMVKINAANTESDRKAVHNCPLCGSKCPRTVEGKFVKKAA